MSFEIRDPEDLRRLATILRILIKQGKTEDAYWLLQETGFSEAAAHRILSWFSKSRYIRVRPSTLSKILLIVLIIAAMISLVLFNLTIGLSPRDITFIGSLGMLGAAQVFATIVADELGFSTFFLFLLVPRELVIELAREWNPDYIYVMLIRGIEEGDKIFQNQED